MAHHIMQIPETDLPTDEGRALNSRELGNEGLFQIGMDPTTGDGIYTVPCVDPCDGTHPGKELTRGFLNERHQALPVEIKPHVFRADVFRSAGNLRRQLENDMGKTIPPGRRADEDVRAEARLRSEKENPSVHRRRVPMAEIQDGDVIDLDDIYPMRMAGEISTR